MGYASHPSRRGQDAAPQDEPIRLCSGLHLGDGLRQQFAHARADLGFRDALGRKVACKTGDDSLVAAFGKNACDGLSGVGCGRVTCDSQLLRRLQAEQAVSPRLGLEFQLAVEGEFLLEGFLAFVEGGHGESSFRTAVLVLSPSRCGEAPRYLNNSVNSAGRERQTVEVNKVKLAPSGPDRLYWIDQSDRFDSRLGSRSVSWSLAFTAAPSWVVPLGIRSTPNSWISTTHGTSQ